MWELDHKESWEPKNWCFWTVVLEKTLESPLDNRRSNQSILKAINSEHSLQGLMLKLKWNSRTLATWCEVLTYWKKPWLWERLRVGGEGDDRGWDGWMASRLKGYEFEWTPGVGVGQGGLACCGFMGLQRVRHDWATELNWTELNPVN